jgi:hypothetical protein
LEGRKRCERETGSPSVPVALQALVCGLLLLHAPGCLLVGRRYLRDDWGPDADGTVLGLHLPIPVGRSFYEKGTWSVWPEIEWLRGTQNPVMEDLSVGIWVPWWTSNETVGPSTVVAYCGGGLSHLWVRFERDYVVEEDRTLGGYVHLGCFATGPKGPFLIGAELRYSFGLGLMMHGQRHEPDGFQLMLVINNCAGSGGAVR